MINELELTIWGRQFLLPVEYEMFEDDIVTDKQKEAIENSKNDIELYCKAQVMSDKMNEKKDNIFSYVKPDYLFIEQNDQEPSVALMLNYRYDPEHGLAVVYKLNGEVMIGNQDIII